MLTSSQIRAARGMLAWGPEDLAQKIGSTRQTINRLERSEGIPQTRTQTLLDIQTAFEEAGLEFIGTPDNGQGVRFRPRG